VPKILGWPELRQHTHTQKHLTMETTCPPQVEDVLTAPSDDLDSTSVSDSSRYQFTDDQWYTYSSTGNYIDHETKSPWGFDDDFAPWSYENVTLLAPMVRASTLPLRWISRERGCSIVYTEETVDLKLAKCIRRVCKLTGLIEYVLPNEANGLASGGICHKVFHTYPGERVALQLGTGSGVNALKAAENVIRDVRAIDINMGCPKLFSLQGAMGSALLSKPEIVADIISTLKRNLPVPVTCKIRLLQDPARSVELVRIAEKCGVDAIAVHARFREDRPRHRALPALQTPLLASAVSVPVIHNGDVFLWEDIERFRSAAAVSSVMIGRGAMWNPSIFGRRFEWEPLLADPTLVDNRDFRYDYMPDTSRADANGIHPDWAHTITTDTSTIRDTARSGLKEICPVKMMDYVLRRRDRSGAVLLNPRKHPQGIVEPMPDVADEQQTGPKDSNLPSIPFPVVCSYKHPSVMPKPKGLPAKERGKESSEEVQLGTKRPANSNSDEQQRQQQPTANAESAEEESKGVSIVEENQIEIARAPPGVHASVELGLPPDLNWEWSDEYPHYANRRSLQMVPPYVVASRYVQLAAACETGISNCKWMLGEILKMCPKVCSSKPYVEEFTKSKTYLTMARVIELCRDIPSMHRVFRPPLVPSQYELRPKTGLAPDLRGNSKRVRAERAILLAERAQEVERLQDRVAERPATDALPETSTSEGAKSSPAAATDK